MTEKIRRPAVWKSKLTNSMQRNTLKEQLETDMQEIYKFLDGVIDGTCTAEGLYVVHEHIGRSIG